MLPKKNHKIKNHDLFLTRKQTAAILGCKASTLASWKTNEYGSLPYVEIENKHIKYLLSDVIKFIEESIVKN